jgi:hypothetical protein
MHELRTTTGQSVTIGYDPSTNTMVFRESDWYPDPVRSSAVPPKAQFRRRLGESTVLKPVADRPKRRRVATPAKAVVWLREPAGLGV